MLSRRQVDLALCLSLLVAAPAAGEVRVDVGSALPDANGRVAVQVTLRTDGEKVGGVQNDILFNHDVLALDMRDCVIHPSIGLYPPSGSAGLTCFDDPSIGPCKNLHKNVIACRDSGPLHGCPATAGPEVSIFRGILAATAAPNDQEIPNGAVLYSCTFRVLDDDRLPQRLVNQNIVVSDLSGDRHPDVDGDDGSVCVNAGTRWVCAQQVDLGRPCTGAVDCLPNDCSRAVELCVPAATPTPRVSKTPTASPPLTPLPTRVPTATPPPLGEIDPIAFIVGTGVELGPGPQFVAVADFNGDDLDDAAVSSPAGILLSNGMASFEERIALPAEPNRGPLVVVDLNRDDNDDVIALVTESPTLVFNLSQGGGRFAESASISLPSVALTLTASDLEDGAIPEIIVTGIDGVLRILRSTATDGLQLAVVESIDLGGNPTEVAVADLNNDGRRDLLVLDTGSSGSLIALLARGEGGFDRRDVALAGEAIGIAVADFADDGFPDVAVLSTGGGSEHIAVLANVLDAADPVASFVERHSFPVSCPGSFSGQPVSCSVKDIAAGDFNLDGLTDLAVAVSTWLTDAPDVQVPGLVQGFIGLGDGSFLFSVRVNVGLGPKRLAVGDFDGDLYIDLVVAEEQIDPIDGRLIGSTVRIVRALPPGPPRGDGGCRQHRQCASGACVDGVCCLSQSCPDGERCDIPGFEGQCHLVAELGDSCGDGEQCASGFCVDGFCCSAPRCPAGVFCNTGSCGPPVPIVEPCNANEQCASGFCVERLCCEVGACPSGLRCDIPGHEGLCHPRLQRGSACVEDGHCDAALFCTDGVCCASDDCGRDQACNRSSSLGICAPPPTPAPPPASTRTAVGAADQGQASIADDGCTITPASRPSLVWLVLVGALLVIGRCGNSPHRKRSARVLLRNRTDDRATE